MKDLNKAYLVSLHRFLVFFIIVIFFTISSIFFWMNSKPPRYTGNIYLKGLHDTVEVFTDEFGVPRIFAKNLHDVFFTLGYVQARERLFQFQLMKRVIAGRISEVVGEKGLSIDKYYRTLGFVRNSKAYLERNLHKISKQDLDMVYSYCEGVNAFISEENVPAEAKLLGLEMEPIQIEDVMGFVAFMAATFGEGVHADPVITSLELQYGKMVEELTQEVVNYNLLTNFNTQDVKYFAENTSSFLEKYHAFLEEFGLPLFQGSNSWVISPKKSKSGKAMLSNDPHIAFSNPSIWFEAYLHTPEFEIYGHFLPMIPFAVIGFNQHHAWGLTMFENDDMDFYKEKIVESKENVYLYKGKEYPLEIIEEKIFVRGKDPVTLKIRSTIHGPIMNEVLDSTESLKFPVALRWSMFDDSNEHIKAFVGFNFSKSLTEFQNSASYLKAPGLNIVYADKDGNIAYFACGGLYDNNFPTDRILDGESGKFEWGREIPFSARPKKINPPEGYIFTANHKHFGNLPYRISGYWQANDRTERLQKLFKSKEIFDKKDMVEFILDDYFTSADFYLPDLLAVLKKNEANLLEIEKKGLRILEKWDKRGKIEEAAPAIYAEFLLQLGRKIFLDEFEEKRYKSIANTSRIHHFMRNVYKNLKSPWWDNVNTKSKESKEDILLDAYKTSIAVLMGKISPKIETWKWGITHTLLLKHPLGNLNILAPFFNSGPRAVDGGSETVNNMLYKYSDTTHEVKAGPSMRTIVDYSDLENIYLINPLGQSAHRLSPHFQDQAEIFVKGEFRNVNLLNMAVGKKLILTPKKE